MLDALKIETERLARSWMQHEPAKLRDYLVAGVEDPRINLQSILSRHFLVRAVFGEKFRALMEQECRFAAAMNWLIALAANSEAQELDALIHALRRGADNVEGLEIPRFILATFASLPLSFDSLIIPNYIETYLERATLQGESLDTFQCIWRESLADENVPQGQAISILEPACGSANDYRFLHSFGIARFLDYSGIDLCAKNIENARELFCAFRSPTGMPALPVHFDVGNVFEIDAPDHGFELSFVHDLFEHLSIEGLDAAVSELCRVTRRAICANFFQMDEIPDHMIRPTDEYYWNLLSMDQMKRLFATHGFTSQVIRVKSFLRQEFGCDYTHNAKAYTLILRHT